MADLFQIGLSGIYSSQAKLNTTSHNIANVSTEGYSRQSVNVETAGGFRTGSYFVGQGSYVQSIERAYDQFAFTENTLNTSQLGYATEVYQQASQMDMLLSDESTSVTQPVLEVFDSINAIADNPNGLEQRTVFLETADNMINQYNRLYDNLEIQYASINNDIVNTAQTITTLADNIAQINEQISIVTGGNIGDNPNDLLDQRDQAISELSQYVDVSTVDTDNGMVNVYIGSGQSLVLGVVSLEMIAVNGNPDPSRKELAFTIDGNTSSLSGDGLGGKVAAMFDIRDNELEAAFSQLGQNIIGLTHSINEQQKEGQTLTGEIGEDIFNDVNSTESMRNRVLAHDDGLGSAQLSVRIDDLSTLTADEYELVVDAYAVGPPESISFTSTNKTTGESEVISIADMSLTQRVDIPNSGVSIGIDSITASDPLQAGKTFTLRPTRFAAQEATLQHKDPEKVAAADAEIKAIAADANTGDAVLRTSGMIDPLDSLYMDADNPLTIDITAVDPLTGEITYDILNSDGNVINLPSGSANNYVPAKVVNDPLSGLTLTPDTLTGKVTFDLAGVTVEMISGSPAAGDQFTINYNETGDGDNRNALEIASLQTAKTMNNNKATFADVYNSMLSEIGAKTANAEVSMESITILQSQSFDRIQSMSGVNMDEEAANLLQFQQYYSAAARVISVASEIFDTILQTAR